MDHAKRMKTGELGYGDDWVRWKGKTYARKDGKIKYNGKWMVEGHRDFPWEKIADKAMVGKRPDKKHDGRHASAAFQSSAMKVHNDTKEGEESFYATHIKDANGDWNPMSGQQGAK